MSEIVDQDTGDKYPFDEQSWWADFLLGVALATIAIGEYVETQKG